MAKILLKGSERSAVSGARVVGPANPAERLEVSVLVRRRGKQAMQARLAAVSPGKRIGAFEQGRICARARRGSCGFRQGARLRGGSTGSRCCRSMRRAAP